jgi:hypothetical protein
MTPRASTAILLLVVLVPAASAQWRSAGQTEPNTPPDSTDGFAWASTPSGGSRVYFNAFEMTSDPGMNPNLAAGGLRLQATPTLRFAALLGEWRDCNGDGYLGLSETGEVSYRVEVAALLGANVASECPVGSEHNDGAVVHELLAIGSHAADAPGIVDQPGTRVWGDRGVPGASGYEGCTIAPAARGTDSRTGKMLRYADCAMEHGIIDRVNEVDAECDMHLCMDPDHPDESDSILNQDTPVNLFGSPYTGQTGLLERGSGSPTLTMWDCASGDPAARVSDTPASASAWDSADEASARCGPSILDALYPFDVVEAPANAPAHEAKSENDVVFRFAPAWGSPAGFVLVPFHDPGAGPEKQASVTAPIPDRSQPVWIADEQYLALPPTVSRNDASPQGPMSWTFYAWLGNPAGFELPHAGEGVYGGEACTGAIGDNAPPQEGWTCDPSAWWQDVAGSTRHAYSDGEVLGSVPGDLFQLRDVDCDDGAPVLGACPQA